ncbi:hypothetical protein BCLUESOX_1598 [bacterium endosymbiont of Bathymodiolus sp. 5 South]|nr:hypothetical protein BCLUESOX_1598 [bacterium endosymbiont of Bathymodiolus sp. 5 South]
MHLGDSRLQSAGFITIFATSCDLHLGDSRLQSLRQLRTAFKVVICI